MISLSNYKTNIFVFRYVLFGKFIKKTNPKHPPRVWIFTAIINTNHQRKNFRSKELHSTYIDVQVSGMFHCPFLFNEHL